MPPAVEEEDNYPYISYNNPADTIAYEEEEEEQELEQGEEEEESINVDQQLVDPQFNAYKAPTAPMQSAPKTTQPSPPRSVGSQFHAPPTFLSRLEEVPQIRDVPWRVGQELTVDRGLESPRVQQRGACLLATRGVVNAHPCDVCATGKGRFKQCITLENCFQGACSTCVFTSKGNKCSFRLQKNGETDGRKARYRPVEQGGMGDERSQPGSRKRARHSAAMDLVNNKQTNGPTGMRHTVDQSPPEDSITVAIPDSPLDSITLVSPEKTVSPDMDSVLQAEIAGEQPFGGLWSYVQESKKRQKRNLVEKNTPDSIRAAGLPLSIAFNPVPTSIITTTNAPSSPAPAGLTTSIRENSRIPSSLGPSLNTRQRSAVIDTLPKVKQRQIFGLISGIQGGIDHLQKQLNLLQASLGIEVEEDR